MTKKRPFYLADYIGIIHEGRLIQYAQSDDVYKHPATLTVSRFLGIENEISMRVVDKTFDNLVLEGESVSS